jgi:hypothetical protein
MRDKTIIRGAFYLLISIALSACVLHFIKIDFSQSYLIYILTPIACFAVIRDVDKNMHRRKLLFASVFSLLLSASFIIGSKITGTGDITLTFTPFDLIAFIALFILFSAATVKVFDFIESHVSYLPNKTTPPMLDGFYLLL